MHLDYFVVEPDPVIQLDIIGALQAAYPSSAVQMTATLSDLPFDARCKTSCAVVNPRIVTPQDSLAMSKFVEAGGQLISLRPLEEVGCPITVLERPFTTETLLSAVASGASERIEIQPVGHT